MSINNPAMSDAPLDRPSVDRVAIIGASLIQGLGYEGTAFGDLAAEQVGAAEVLQFAATSRTCQQTLDEFGDDIRGSKADLAIMMIGGTDSLMRPSHRIQEFIERYAPPSWHGVAGLDPRARYSRGRWRAIRQRVESTAKIAIKHVLFFLFGGGAPRIPFDEFARSAEQLIAHTAASCGHVVVVGLPTIDRRKFPRTPESFARVNGHLAHVSADTTNATFVPLDPLLEQWADFLADNFHLGAGGHARVAERIVAIVNDSNTVWTRPGQPTNASSVDDVTGRGHQQETRVR